MTGFYAARTLGEVYGPFDTAKEATDYCFQWEATRYGHKMHGADLPPMGWRLTHVSSPEDGISTANALRWFDHERLGHRLFPNAKQAEAQS